MFQWAAYLFGSLVKCISRPISRKPLDCLPGSLSRKYTTVLSELHDDDYEVVLKILQWLLFSNRPLSLEELAEVAAIDVVDNRPTIVRVYEPHDLLKLCPELLTEVEVYGTSEKDHNNRTFVQIAHVSVRDYLLSDEIGKSRVSRFQVTEANAHSDITKTCLLYMQLIDESFEIANQGQFPLASYVAEHWLSHYEMVPAAEERLHTYVCRFFTTHTDVYQRWADYFFPDTLNGFKDELRPYTLRSPVNTAAAYGLIPLLKAMFESDVIDMNNKNVLNDVLRASKLQGTFPRPPRSNLEVTKFLVEHGADFTGDDRWRSTLDAASYYGLYELVKAEIEEGAESDSQKDKYTSALNAAIQGRYMLNYQSGGNGRDKYLEKIKPSCIELLLENGANPNGAKEGFSSALSLSCHRGDIVVAKLLLAHGADPNHKIPKSSGCTQFSRSCLSSACFSRDIRIIKLLLDHGADVNSPGALFIACWVPNPDIVRLLLERGANPNGTDEGEMPLRYSCARGCETSVDLLLQHGADVHLPGGITGSPLNEAAWNGYSSIVKKLVGKGVDVNLKAGTRGAALQDAAHSGQIDVIEYLLKNGADVNLHAGYFHTALQAALMWPHPEIIILLLKNGADLAVESPYGSTFTEALSRVPQDLCEIYIEQYSTKTSTSTWRAVKKPVTASFTDYDKLEVLELNSPKDKADPTFLCSFEPL